MVKLVKPRGKPEPSLDELVEWMENNGYNAIQGILRSDNDNLVIYVGKEAG